MSIDDQEDRNINDAFNVLNEIELYNNTEDDGNETFSGIVESYRSLLLDYTNEINESIKIVNSKYENDFLNLADSAEMLIELV